MNTIGDTGKTPQAYLFDNELMVAFLVVGDDPVFGPSSNSEIYTSQDTQRFVLVTSELVSGVFLGLRLRPPDGKLAGKLVEYHDQEQFAEDRWWLDGRRLAWFDVALFNITVVANGVLQARYKAADIGDLTLYTE